MKYFVLLLVSIGLVQCAPEIRTEANNGINHFIVGGTNATEAEFPSVVFIELPPPRNSCGGTIISNEHVVTAAHCLVQDTYTVEAPYAVINAGLLRIIAGDRNSVFPSFGRVTRHAVNVYIHPRFNPYTLENDIAVIRLSEPLQLPDNFIDVATRRQRIVPVGEQCVFAGWDLRSHDDITPPSPLLQRLNFASVDQQNCNLLHGGRILESMMCAASGVLDVGAVCFGNEGGGLYCNNQLAGILSLGAECINIFPDRNRPGVYTQVRFYNDWLDEQIERDDTPDASLWKFP